MYRTGEKVVVTEGVKVYSLRFPMGVPAKKTYVVTNLGDNGVALYWRAGYQLKWAAVTDVKPAPLPLEVLAQKVIAFV